MSWITIRETRVNFLNKIIQQVLNWKPVTSRENIMNIVLKSSKNVVNIWFY